MTWTSQTTVGAFVLGGAVLAVGATVLFGKLNVFHPPVHAAVVFEGSVTGLAVGAPVTFRGVRVGSINRIEVTYDAKTRLAYIPVTMELGSDLIQLKDIGGGEKITLSTAISRGLRAELNLQSFVTGQSEINLDFDPESAAVLHAGVIDLQEIPTRPSAIQRVKDQLSDLPLRELVDNANATLKGLRELSDTLGSQLPALIKSVTLTSDRSALVVEAAMQGVKDLQGRLDITLAGIDRLTVAGEAQLSQRGEELHTMLVSTNRTVLQAHDVMADLRGLTAERGAARTNIDAALRDVAAATASLRGFAGDIEHNPQLLLSGRRP